MVMAGEAAEWSLSRRRASLQLAERSAVLAERSAVLAERSAWRPDGLSVEVGEGSAGVRSPPPPSLSVVGFTLDEAHAPQVRAHHCSASPSNAAHPLCECAERLAKRPRGDGAEPAAAGGAADRPRQMGGPFWSWLLRPQSHS